MTVNLSDKAEDIADILEWICMTNPTGYLSWTDVIRKLTPLSKDEAIEAYEEPSAAYLTWGGDLLTWGGDLLTWGGSNIAPVPPETEIFEAILDDWIESLCDRAQACGSNNAYPFDITKYGLDFRKCSSPAYQFQLLVSLSKGNTPAGEVSVHKLFEELSAAAAGQYLGDSRTSVVFGYPRRDLPKDFRSAVNHLAELLREGTKCNDRQGIQRAKDDKLDVVAWKEFPDRKPSKLILFGQCATGRHWNEKVHELLPKKWCKRNFRGSLAVDPIPAFFVPRILSEENADYAGSDQILLDRCRISALCSGTLNDQLEERLWSWIRTTLRDNEQEYIH